MMSLPTEHPQEPTDESDSVSDGNMELSPDDELCLSRIENMGRESLQGADDIQAVLGYFAARHMELALLSENTLRQVLSEQKGLLHDVPVLHRLLATNVILVRQYQNDLDLAERHNQSRRKADNGNRPRRLQAGLHPSEHLR
jgi:hypothetical protein